VLNYSALLGSWREWGLGRRAGIDLCDQAAGTVNQVVLLDSIPTRGHRALWLFCATNPCMARMNGSWVDGPRTRMTIKIDNPALSSA